MNYKNISPHEVQEMLNAPGTILIDVRNRDEYEEQSIPGSILMPLSEFEVEKIPVTAKNIIIHCHLGGRSARACEALNVQLKIECFNLEGGIKAWVEAGLPVR